MTDWQEINFDGLVGPTHNYAGLSQGNLASGRNKGAPSNPRAGVLQGLGKMRFMLGAGMAQGLLPPHERPNIPALRALGYAGSDETILATAWRDNPTLVTNLCSASAMWTANAATVSPSPDTADGRTHFTPANLAAMYHRSIEAPLTASMLQTIFPEGERFAHHAPVAGGVHMGDEGAANHNRFASHHGAQGVEVFVYGQTAFAPREDLRFPARQIREASEAIARMHGLDPARSVFYPQSAAAINTGAFHNDVVAVSNGTCFFYHQDAFEDPAAMQQAVQAAADFDIAFLEVPRDAVSLRDAISTYLFNSQLVEMPGSNGMTLILPVEAEENPAVATYVEALKASDAPINAAHYMDVRQSMRNGGGPACLRLRVVLSAPDRAAMAGCVLMTPDRLDALEAWGAAHYRDHLAPDDLGDPALWRESFTALDRLTDLLGLGSLYDFQRTGA